MPRWKARLDVIGARLAASDDGLRPIVRLVGPDAIRAWHATTPPVRLVADGLGLLTMLGYPIDRALQTRHGIASRGRILRAYDRITEPGRSGKPRARIETLDDMSQRLQDYGFVVALGATVQSSDG